MGDLARSGAEAVVVAARASFPLGMALSAGRRAALLDWARAGRLVVEDDYDAEFPPSTARRWARCRPRR